jgi:GNAT superfamily N-acetyltransferase
LDAKTRTLPDVVRIVFLSERPELAALLAPWHHQEWSALYPGWTLQACLAELQSQRDPARLPSTLVALSAQDELLGSVSLLLEDLPGSELSPWLASLYVRADQRRKGVGAQLIERAVEHARALGIERLFLFTPAHERYYAARGWGALERSTLLGQPISIMTRDTTD